jgi:hypothetical protein
VRTARLHGQLQSLSQNKPKGGIRSMNTARTGLKSKALHEAKKFFWIFIYLWLCFGLFVLYKALILAEQHIDYTGYGLAAVKALVLGKVILIAEGLQLAERHQDRPLIYPTLYKSLVFFVVLPRHLLAVDLEHPVPPRPMPLKLLKASVPIPRPSYLKSNSSVCLPGLSASAPSQRIRFKSTRFHRNTGLPFST